jgi:hypothetical protein
VAANAVAANAVAVIGEPVHVEKINQSPAPCEAVAGVSAAAQPVARGVDCQPRRMLP